MKNNLKWIISLCLTLLLSSVMGANKDIELLRTRVMAEVMDYPVDDARVKTVFESFILSDSIWPGLNYENTSKEYFEHRYHLDNMLLLTRAYKKKSSKYHNNKQVKKVIDLALDYWLSHDFICENVWHNEIGTPDAMISMSYLLDKELRPDQNAVMRKIAARAHKDAQYARPSGDRAKILALTVKETIFNRDEPAFEDAIKELQKEIRFLGEENVKYSRGMQYDYSFHHRVDRVNNTTSYGLGYANGIAEWADKVSDTRYRFSDEAMRHFVDYFLDGICKQMVYGRTTDPGVLNRDIVRRGLHQAGPQLPERILRCTNYRKDELENVIKARKKEDFERTSFARFFWQTEHFAFQRPNYYTSVRMYSTRNANMEVPYNTEGLRNHYRGDGTNYISITENEYLDISPVNDWRKIPGATVLQKEGMPSPDDMQHWGTTEFVGAVTDGLYGAVGFDFASVHDPVFAKKSWFFFDDEYVCLGAGIEARSNHTVATTMNQHLLRGDVIVGKGQQKNVQAKGNRQLDNPGWVYHDQIGYIFPEPAVVNLSNEAQHGNWRLVNQMSTIKDNSVSMDMFKLWVDHGRRPRGASYAYVVMPGTNVAAVQAAALDPRVEIMANTPDLQAVRHKSLNIGYAIFFSAGKIDLGSGLSVSMDSPGAVMVKYDAGGNPVSFSVSDPGRRLGRIHFALNRKVDFSNDICKSVWNAADGVSYLSVDLPKGQYAGSSVTIDLK